MLEVIIKDEKSAILIPPGSIDIRNSAELKDCLGKLVDEGFLYVEVDFSNVEVVDSTALGRLLLCHKHLKDKGGFLKIIKVSSDYVEKIFETIRLSKVIEYERA